MVRLSLKIPRTDERPFDVTGFGLNSIDLLAVVAEHPAVNSKQRLQRVTRLPGGQIATALATCAKLGWRTSYIGAFGGDDHGALSRQSLLDAGVDVSGEPHGRERHESVRHHPCGRPVRASERSCGTGILISPGILPTSRNRR